MIGNQPPSTYQTENIGDNSISVAQNNVGTELASVKTHETRLDAVDASLAAKKEEDQKMREILTDERILARNLNQMSDNELSTIYKQLQAIRKDRSKARMDAEKMNSVDAEVHINLKSRNLGSRERQTYESSMLSKIIALSRKDVMSRLADWKTAMCSQFCPILVIAIITLVTTQVGTSVSQFQISKDATSPDSERSYVPYVRVDFDPDWLENYSPTDAQWRVYMNYSQNVMQCIDNTPINAQWGQSNLYTLLRNEFVAFPIEGKDGDYTNPDDIEASLLWEFYGVGAQHVAGVKSLFPDLLGTQSWRGIYTTITIKDFRGFQDSNTVRGWYTQGHLLSGSPTNLTEDNVIVNGEGSWEDEDRWDDEEYNPDYVFDVFFVFDDEEEAGRFRDYYIAQQQTTETEISELVPPDNYQPNVDIYIRSTYTSRFQFKFNAGNADKNADGAQSFWDEYAKVEESPTLLVRWMTHEDNTDNRFQVTDVDGTYKGVVLNFQRIYVQLMLGSSIDFYLDLPVERMHIAKCTQGIEFNNMEVPIFNWVQWDGTRYDRHIKSFKVLSLFGLFWAVVMMYTTPGKVLNDVVRERQTGIKGLMTIMGLDIYSYWISQFISFVIESAFYNITLGICIACAISKFLKNTDDQGANSFYVWFAFVFSFFNCAPMVFALSSLIPTDKDVNAAVNLLRFVVPFFAILISFNYVNSEPTWARMLICFLPQANFQFALRDAVMGDIKADVVLMLFINPIFWWCLTIYFDLTMTTQQGSKERRHCFCIRDCFEGNQGATELISDATFDSSKAASGAIVLDNLTKTFPNGVTAVNGMSLTLEKGSVYGLLGFNGAGKTTTFNMLTGILRPSAGNAYIDGMSVRTDMNKIRDNIGICPQHNIIWPALSVKDHLFLFGRLRGMNDAEIEDQIGPLLHYIGMQDRLYDHAGELSGGQKRKLCLAAAFLGDPNVILLDEPTAGVDAESRRTMWDLILQKKEGRLIILTTHQMREADVLCDSIGIMAEGSLLVEGTPVELKQRYGVGYTLNCSAFEGDEMPKIDMGDEEQVGAKLQPSGLGFPDGSTVPASQASNADLNMSTDSTALTKALGLSELDNICPIECQKNDDGLYTFSVGATDVHHMGKVCKVLEDSNKFQSISVSATSLEDVFLKLAEEQNRKNMNQRRSSFTISGTDGHDENAVAGNKIYPRPNPFTHWLIMTVKRMWLNVLYWGPFVSGLVMVALLAVVIMFITILLGLTIAKFTLKPGDVDKVYCIYPDATPAVCATIQQSWNSLSSVQSISQTRFLADYNGKITSAKNEIYFYMNGDVSDPKIMQILVDPFWGSNFLNAVAEGVDLKLEPNIFAGYSQKSLLVFILLIGVGLIISSTFQYIGKEARGPLYNFQIQCGVHPAVFWLSHYMFDVCINTILVSILMAIGMNKQSSTLVNQLIWCAFLCFLSYVWIQYTFVFHFKSESTISQFLAASSMIALIMFIFEFMFVIFSLSIPQRHYYVWNYDEIKVDSWKACYVINQFVPPMQFFINSFWVVFEAPISGSTSKLKRRLYGFRTMMALFVMVFYGLLFALRLLYEYYKKDPLPQVPLYHASPDVQQEKKKVDNIMTNSDSFKGVICNHVSKVFMKTTGPFLAVKDLCFAVESGKCFGLLGKNGAGKTTALNVLTGMMTSTAGFGMLNGVDTKTSPSGVRRQSGVCPQFQTMWLHFTVYQHLYFAGSLKGVPFLELDAEIKRLCMEIGLTPYIDRQCGHLSGGNKRKLMLATCLIGGAKVLFLDEPSAGVDPVARSSIMEFIKSYKKDRVIILTTHQMEETEWLCDSIGIMVNGDFKAIGTKEQLVKRNASGYSLEMSIAGMTDAQVGVLMEYVNSNLDDTSITEHDKLLVAFGISEVNPLSEIFDVAQNLKEKFNCSYVVGAMSIEQVFLNLTADQRKETYEDLVNAGRMIAKEREKCLGGMCSCCCCCN